MRALAERALCPAARRGLCELQSEERVTPRLSLPAAGARADLETSSRELTEERGGRLKGEAWLVGEEELLAELHERRRLCSREAGMEPSEPPPSLSLGLDEALAMPAHFKRTERT